MAVREGFRFIQLSKYRDLAISIYDNPLPDAATDAEDFDWNHLHIVTVMYQAYDKINLQDIHPLWKDVKEYLAEILPELREKYMVSDSLNESRTLLFLCRFLQCNLSSDMNSTASADRHCNSEG